MCNKCKIDAVIFEVPDSRLIRENNFSYMEKWINRNKDIYSHIEMFDLIWETSYDCLMSYKIMMKNHYPELYKKFITYMLLK